MKQGELTKHQVERLTSAVQHNMDVTDLFDGEFAVEDLDSDSGEAHLVDYNMMSCTCSDYEYRCKNGEYCKHIYRVALEQSDILQTG